MPTYNSAQFVGKTIDCVLKQKFTNFELLIIDDASTDGTWQVLSAYKDERIKCFRNKFNLRQSKARNIAISQSCGEYVAYCDHDDLFSPEHLLLLSDYLDQHRDIGLVYSNFVEVNMEKQQSLQKDRPFNKHRFECLNLICPSVTMHRKSCLEQVGLFDECETFIRAAAGEDWEFFLRLSDYYAVAHLADFTVVRPTYAQSSVFRQFKDKSSFEVLNYLYKKRLAVNRDRAPFSGYYVGIFHQYYLRLLSYERLGEEITANIKGYIKPFFDHAAKQDPDSLSVWLVLLLIAILLKEPKDVVRIAKTAGCLLCQPLELIDGPSLGLVKQTLKGTAQFLKISGNQALAEEYAAKAEELN